MFLDATLLPYFVFTSGKTLTIKSRVSLPKVALARHKRSGVMFLV